jgi:hypothetical protein
MKQTRHAEAGGHCVYGKADLCKLPWLFNINMVAQNFDHHQRDHHLTFIALFNVYGAAANALISSLAI